MKQMKWLLSWIVYPFMRLSRLFNRTRLGVFLDYENISKEAALENKSIDFEALRKELLKIGHIAFAFIFIPEHLVTYSLPRYVYDKGFYVVACPGSGNGKEKDRVDTNMTEMGIRLIEHSDITDLVIVSRDSDFVRLANYARFHGKKVIVFAGKKVSFILKEVADEIFPIPVKEGRIK